MVVHLDHYWRLNRYHGSTIPELKEMLRAKQCYFRSTDPKSVLAATMRRLDSGMLVYGNHNKQDLLRFARRRKLISNRAQKSKDELVAILEDADERTTFTRIVDLPPELRCIIYSKYTEDFPAFLTRPSQPPLARVSKLFRTEYLPIFYLTCGVQIVLEPHHNELRFAEYTWGYIMGLVVGGKLGLVRNLRLAVRGHVRNAAIWKQKFFEFKLDIHGSENSDAVVVHCDYSNGEPLSADWKDDLIEDVRSMFEDVLGRDGKEKLKLDDIYRIRKRMEIAMLS